MNTNTSPHDLKLNSFAITCFRDTADFDYISARQSYRTCLFPQFLWSCEQAIEKYLKCILLLNRVPATKIGHDLVKGLELAERNLPFQIRLRDEIREFITRVDSMGRWRYMEASLDIRRNDLLLLDWTVWTIRRYCQSMNYELRTVSGKLVNMLEPTLQQIEHSETRPPYEFHLNGGRLEDIVKKRDHPARTALVWNNCCFGMRNRKRVRMTTYSAGSNSPFFLFPELLDEAAKYVKVPIEVQRAYKQSAPRAVAANTPATDV